MDDSNSPTATKGCEAGGESSPVDMEKLRQKLQRAYLRRDHYAQLYYQTKSELEETKWQLSVALNRVKQMQTHAPKYKSNSLEYQHPRNDHRISPPDRNGRISPDSGAISMSPGVESTEGHGQLEDDTTADDTVSSASDPTTGNHKISKNNYKMNGINESLTGSGDFSKPTKRVAFRNAHPQQQLSNHGSSHGSYEKMNISSQQQPMLQRSYTFEHGEFNNHFMDGAGGGIKMQRTGSYNQGTRPAQGQFSTFPGSYPMPHPQQMFNGNYSMQPEQHRLPRVHRGYDNGMVPPGMMSPPYHQPPPPPRIIQQQQQQQNQQQQQSSVPPPRPPGISPHHSAFQRVPMKQGGGGTGGSMRVHQYENVMVHPSYYPVPAHVSYQPHPNAPPSHQQQLEHQEKQPFIHGEKWTYSGLTQEEFTQLLSQLSLPNTKVERLEISRSNLGNITLMNLFCKELKKNSSLLELSLPNNEIGRDALKILLTTIAVCKNIKELKLPGNDIGEECLDVLKQFLESCSLRSLILSGNEIEHHTHLLDALLPQDLQYEGIPGSSGNRSLPVSPDQVANNMKLLHI